MHDHTNDIDPTVSSPSSEYIEGADDYGYWYDSSDGNGYLPTNMPQHHAATYYAVKPCFAVYSADDGSLGFYKRFGKPQEGGAIDGKTVTRLYDWGIEHKDFEVIRSNVNESRPLLPWIDEISNIKSVKAVDSGIRPKALSNWCYGMSNATSIDLTLIDTSRCTDFRSLFINCSSIETLDLSNMDMSRMSDSRNMYIGCSRLKKISVSDTFRYAKIDDINYPYLPVPDSNDIDGADGKWYDEATGEGYAPKDVPTGGKGTYFASDKMLPNITLRLGGQEGNVVYGEIDVTNIPFDDYRVEYSTCVDKDNAVSLLQNAEINNVNGDLSNYSLAKYSLDNIFSSAALSYFKNCKIYGKIIIYDNKTSQQITLYTKKITITDDDIVFSHQAGRVFLTISRFKAWRDDTLIDE